MKSDASNNTTSPGMETGSKGASMEIDPAETNFVASNPYVSAVAASASQYINAENVLDELRSLVSKLQKSRKEVKKHHMYLFEEMKTRGRIEDDLRTLIDDLIRKITDLVTDMENKKKTMEALKSPQMAPHLAKVEDLEKICIDFIEESHAELVILKVLMEARRKREHRFKI